MLKDSYFPWRKGKYSLVAYFTRGRRLSMFVALAATLLNVFFSFISPQIMRIIVDSIIGDTPFNLPDYIMKYINAVGGRDFFRENIYICGIVWIVPALLSALFFFLRGFLSREASEKTAKKMRDKLYDYIQSLPFEWHVKIKTGDIIQRCTTDVDTVRNFMTMQLYELVRIVCVITVALVLMFMMDVFMTLISLMLMPIIFVVSLVFHKHMFRRFTDAENAEGELHATVQENLTGVRVVRAFGREKFEMERFDEKNNYYSDLWIRLGDILSNFWAFADMSTSLQLVIVIIFGIFRVTGGGMTVGTFLVFYTYCNMMIWPVRRLGRLISDMSRAGVAATRLHDILRTEPEDNSGEDFEFGKSCSITFENVSFSYEGTSEKVLDNISLELKPGETLAILGGTGSGKSTLVHLLNRLYDLPEGCGRILINGRDIRTIPRKLLRKNVGLVLQEPFLYSKSIKENIAISRRDAPLDEIRHYADIAAIDSSITEFPAGYDTVVGERGVTLSGGQKQRVVIARMLIQRPPIMIFDDSLSAVDTETDSRIRNALKRFSTENPPTVILISHRITTLMQADKIMVLSGGRIEEMGTHEELIKRDGTYRRIFDIQGKMDILQDETPQSDTPDSQPAG